jgi:hypothetical protein
MKKLQIWPSVVSFQKTQKSYNTKFIGTNKNFPAIILVSRFPEWLFGYDVERIILKDLSEAV